MPANPKRYQRIKQDLDTLTREGLGLYYERINDDTVDTWIPGPTDSPYASKYFKVRFIYPEAYPNVPPDVAFLTKIYHPNICPNTQRFDLEDVVDIWDPSIDLYYMIRCFVQLLETPRYAERRLCYESSRLYMSNKDAFVDKARAWAQEYGDIPSLAGHILK